MSHAEFCVLCDNTSCGGICHKASNGRLKSSCTTSSQGEIEVMKTATSEKRLVAVVRALAAEPDTQKLLAKYKRCHKDLARPDFIWHYLLQSFATMGRASGWHGLIGNKANYERVMYPALGAFATVTHSTGPPSLPRRWYSDARQEGRIHPRLLRLRLTTWRTRGGEGKTSRTPRSRRKDSIPQDLSWDRSEIRPQYYDGCLP